MCFIYIELHMYVLTYRVLLDPDGRSKFDDLSKWGLIKLLYSIKLVNWCCVKKQCVDRLYPKHISGGHLKRRV